MRSTIILATAVMGLIGLASATRANAFPTSYSSQDEFHAQGVIDQVTDFSEFAPGTYQFIDDPYVDGDLTITSGGQNVIITTGTAPFFPTHNALISNNGGYLEVEFDPAAQYDLFSFKAGTFKGPFGLSIYMHLNNARSPAPASTLSPSRKASSSRVGRPTRARGSPASPSCETARARAWRWPRSNLATRARPRPNPPPGR